MADSSRVVSLHFPRTMICGFGSLAYLFGLNGIFASYTRLDTRLGDTQKLWQRKEQWSQRLLFGATALMITGLILLLLSTVLYEGEKQAKAADVAGLVQQVRQQNDEKNKIHESAVINGVAAAAVACGFALMIWNFHTTGQFRLASLLLYAVGWLALAVSFSTDSKSLSSTNWKRMAWTFPGAILTIVGTSVLPFERDYVLTGPSMPLIATGLFAMTVGHGYVP